MRSFEKKLADPKYIRRLIRSQKWFNFKTKVCMVMALACIISLRNEINRMSRELEVLKHKEGD